VEEPRGDGEVKYGDELAMRINMNPGYGQSDDISDVILLGNTMYEKGIGERNRPTDGKYNGMSRDALESMGMPDIPGFLDPRSKSKAFRTGISAFKQIGTAETLDGVEATPYAITIDTSKAGETFAFPPGDVKFTFFIGPDDLPRKLMYSDSYGGKFTATYSNWGTPVDIKAPADDEVNWLGSAPN
jgi:hypothetical protein